MQSINDVGQVALSQVSDIRSAQHVRELTVIGLAVPGATNSSSHFIILCNGNIEISRTFHDFRTLMRMLKKLNKALIAADCDILVKDFSVGYVKNINTSFSWRRNGDGWNASILQKSLSNVNNWLALLLLHYPRMMAEFCDDNIYKQQADAVLLRRNNERHARSLQQYFTSDTNVNFLIDKAIMNVDGATALQSPCIYVEPSCGDGRVMKALCRKLCSLYDSGVDDICSVGAAIIGCVIGCEIDDAIASAAISAVVQQHPLNSHIFIQNFLSLTREDVCGACCRLNAGSYASANADLVVLGNPPYTVGGGEGGGIVTAGDAGEDTGRELPLQFLVHAATVLMARRIVFVLPQRCGCDVFIDRVKKLISTVTEGSTPMYSWDVSNYPAPDAEFDFCDRIVRQVTIVQVWERVVHAKGNSTV